MSNLIGERPTDLIVVVPGILGSRLARVDDQGKQHEVWGTGALSIVKNLLTFGRRIQGLAIPDDVDPDEPDDGVVATGVITDLAIIPGFWRIAGYDGMIRYLEADLALEPGQLVSFPYDWRLSCRVNGELLARFLDKAVDIWRRQSANPEARAILVAHSMGGLVSRWCIEKACGHTLVSRLVTLGTPYRGAARALDALANGVRIPRRVGPELDDVVRSIPSARELLPTYACVRPSGGGELQYLKATDVLPSAWVATGAAFHDELAVAVDSRFQTRTDGLLAIVGSHQPTATTAAPAADGSLDIFETVDATTDGIAYKGDGTVPSDSAIPPEWDEDQASEAPAMAQTHASMQLSESARVELGYLLAKRPRMRSDAAQLELRCPEAIVAGETFDVLVDGPRNLGLRVEVGPLVGTPITSVNCVTADGRYKATIRDLAPGAHLVTVNRLNERSTPVEVLSEIVLAYTED